MATSLFWVGFPYALMSLTHSFWMLPACVTPAGAGVGIEFGVTAIGSAISPALFGMIADAYDLYTGFYFLAGIIAASNFLIVFIPNSAAVQARPVAVN